MKNLKTTLLLSLCLISANLFSQLANNTVAEQPYIEVTGSAELEIVPDEIYITITIHERTEGKEKITIATQEDKLKSELTTLGISLENLVLSDANADYIRVRWTKKDVLAKTEYILMVSDAKTVRSVFEKLGKLKIHDANISSVSHSKIEEYREEVKTNAIIAAKNKATYLLTAIGEQVGKPLIVRELSRIPNSRQTNVRKSNFSYGYVTKNEISSSSTSINFQKMTISSSIYVKFLIN